MKIINLNTKHIFNLPKKAADELLSDPSGKTEMIKKEDNLNNLILSEILDE